MRIPVWYIRTRMVHTVCVRYNIKLAVDDESKVGSITAGLAIEPTVKLRQKRVTKQEKKTPQNMAQFEMIASYLDRIGSSASNMK